MNTSNKEIDIFELYRLVSRFFRRHIVLLLVIVVIGAAFGFIKVKMKGQTYQSRIIVKSDFISKENLSIMVLPLLENNEQMTKADLALIFNADESVFNSVSKITIDTLSINNGIVFKLSLQDTTSLSDMIKAVERYYNTSSEVQAQFLRIQTRNQQYVDALKAEIGKINAYQKKVLTSGSSSQNLMLSGFSGSSEELVKLFEKQQNMEQKLHAIQPVSVEQNSLILSKPASLTSAMILWALAFGVIGLLILLVFELDRSARRSA
jgi:hypothetical protein